MGKIYIVAYIVYLTVMILLIYQSLSYEIEAFLGLLGLLIGTSMVLLFMSFYNVAKEKITVLPALLEKYKTLCQVF